MLVFIPWGRTFSWDADWQWLFLLFQHFLKKMITSVNISPPEDSSVLFLLITFCACFSHTEITSAYVVSICLGKWIKGPFEILHSQIWCPTSDKGENNKSKQQRRPWRRLFSLLIYRCFPVRSASVCGVAPTPNHKPTATGIVSSEYFNGTSFTCNRIAAPCWWKLEVCWQRKGLLWKRVCVYSLMSFFVWEDCQLGALSEVIGFMLPVSQELIWAHPSCDYCMHSTVKCEKCQSRWKG